MKNIQKWTVGLCLSYILGFCWFVCHNHEEIKIELIQITRAIDEPYYSTQIYPAYESKHGDIEPGDIQCPVPMKDRVRNYTGIQCVFSSLELLGRWAEEPKLMAPPITSRSDCKGYSGPGDVRNKLTKLGVKFKQITGNKEKGIELIKVAMAEGRGALIGIPGHAMVCVHYDETTGIMKYVDNSDKTLKVQSMTTKDFYALWRQNGYWVCVIYADKEVIPLKTGKAAKLIPIETIEDKYNTKDFIPFPKKKAA